MPEFLGLDTSNYTTSAALYISEEQRIVQSKQLLPVREGELGLRQSDAVFHHTKQLPDMIEQLSAQYSDISPSVVTASARPRNIEGSYMPCFLVGEGCALREVLPDLKRLRLPCVRETSRAHICRASSAERGSDVHSQPLPVRRSIRPLIRSDISSRRSIPRTGSVS